MHAFTLSGSHASAGGSEAGDLSRESMSKAGFQPNSDTTPMTNITAHQSVELIFCGCRALLHQPARVYQETFFCCKAGCCRHAEMMGLLLQPVWYPKGHSRKLH